MCIEILQISGDLNWAQAALEAFIGKCEDIIDRNITIWDRDNSSNIICPPPVITDKLCPNDCSQHGLCDKGRNTPKDLSEYVKILNTFKQCWPFNHVYALHLLCQLPFYCVVQVYVNVMVVLVGQTAL